MNNIFLWGMLMLALLTLSGCASLHDGKGFEHEPGNSSIEHRH